MTGRWKEEENINNVQNIFAASFVLYASLPLALLFTSIMTHELVSIELFHPESHDFKSPSQRFLVLRTMQKHCSWWMSIMSMTYDIGRLNLYVYVSIINFSFNSFSTVLFNVILSKHQAEKEVSSFLANGCWSVESRS